MGGALFFAILTIFGWGSAAVVDKLALYKGDPLIGLTIRGITIFIVLSLAILFTGKAQALVSFVQSDLRTTSLFALSGLLAGCGAMFTYYLALQLADVSQITPITSSYPLVAALLAFFILKEHLSLERIAGILLIIAGIYLIQLKTA